jgi:predicted nucleic acid-binding protein
VASDWADAWQLSSHSRVTDCNLLALASSNGGKLVNLGQKLATEVVTNGKAVRTLL